MWSDPNLRVKKYIEPWPKMSYIPNMVISYKFLNGIPQNAHKVNRILLNRIKLRSQGPLSKSRPYDLDESSYWYRRETTYDHYRRLRKYDFFGKPRL